MEPKSQPDYSAPIYHMLVAEDWARDTDKPYADSSLAREGFIHFSGDPATLMRVANGLYRGEPGNWLILEVDPSRLYAPVKWEQVGNGHFPHLYGELNRDAVIRVIPFPRREDGRFDLPVEWSAFAPAETE